MRKLLSCVLIITTALAVAGMATVTTSTGVQRDNVAKHKEVAHKNIYKHLQNIHVSLKSGRGEGSGTIKVTKDGQVWIWTCGHVVEGVRSKRVTDDGKVIISFDDLKATQVITKGGRVVGEITFDAEVIRYSNIRDGEDLALLRLRDKTYRPAESVQFYLGKNIPDVGTRLIHCGSFLGKVGSASVTQGVVSYVGRVFDGKILDQTDAGAFPGSSGGAVCLAHDGRYVGMLTRGFETTYCFYVPIRTISAWAKRVGVEFAINDNIPVPCDEELFAHHPIDCSDLSLDARRDAHKKGCFRCVP